MHFSPSNKFSWTQRLHKIAIITFIDFALLYTKVFFIALCRKKTYLKTCASNSHLKYAANVNILYLLPVGKHYLHTYSVLTQIISSRKQFQWVDYLSLLPEVSTQCSLPHFLTSTISHVLIKQNQTQTQRFRDTLAKKTFCQQFIVTQTHIRFLLSANLAKRN